MNYSMIFGVHPSAEGIVKAILEIPFELVPRFRDAYPVHFEGTEADIELVTRAGSGAARAEDYDPQIEKLRDHPLYVGDYEVREVYRVFHFRYPQEGNAAEAATKLRMVLLKHPNATYTKTLEERFDEVDAQMEANDEDTQP
jgi:hypothetical protein